MALVKEATRRNHVAVAASRYVLYLTASRQIDIPGYKDYWFTSFDGEINNLNDPKGFLLRTPYGTTTDNRHMMIGWVGSTLFVPRAYVKTVALSNQ